MRSSSGLLGIEDADVDPVDQVWVLGQPEPCREVLGRLEGSAAVERLPQLLFRPRLEDGRSVDASSFHLSLLCGELT